MTGADGNVRTITAHHRPLDDVRALPTEVRNGWSPPDR